MKVLTSDEKRRVQRSEKHNELVALLATKVKIKDSNNFKTIISGGDKIFEKSTSKKKVKCF